MLPELYANLGQALRLKGETDEAVEVYKDGIQRFPNESLLYFCYGVALAELGKAEDSEQAKRKARSLGWMLDTCGYVE